MFLSRLVKRPQHFKSQASSLWCLVHVSLVSYSKEEFTLVSYWPGAGLVLARYWPGTGLYVWQMWIWTGLGLVVCYLGCGVPCLCIQQVECTSDWGGTLPRALVKLHYQV